MLERILKRITKFHYSLLLKASTGGSVVEFSPATREARVRFPAVGGKGGFWLTGYDRITVLTVLQGFIWKKVGLHLIKNGGFCAYPLKKPVSLVLKTGLTGFNRFYRYH